MRIKMRDPNKPKAKSVFILIYVYELPVLLVQTHLIASARNHVKCPQNTLLTDDREYATNVALQRVLVCAFQQKRKRIR